MELEEEGSIHEEKNEKVHSISLTHDKDCITMYREE